MLSKSKMGITHQVMNWGDTFERLQFLIEARVAT